MTVHGLTLRAPVEIRQIAALHRVAHTLRAQWMRRRDCPRLAFLAIPLAMNATGMVWLWWTWPLLLAGAAACTPAWRWSWVLTFQLGAIGTQWAYDGGTALGMWPDHRILIGVLWAGAVIALGIAADFNQRYHDRRKRRS